MPQLSPMMGFIVFVLTNLSFITLVLSVRGASKVGLNPNSLVGNKKSFRSFSQSGSTNAKILSIFHKL